MTYCKTSLPLHPDPAEDRQIFLTAGLPLPRASPDRPFYGSKKGWSPPSYVLTGAEATLTSKSLAAHRASVRGMICIVNCGTVVAHHIAATLRLICPPEAAVLATVAVDTSRCPVLAPGDSCCYHYQADVGPLTPVSGETCRISARATCVDHGAPSQIHGSPCLQICALTMQMVDTDRVAGTGDNRRTVWETICVETTVTVIPKVKIGAAKLTAVGRPEIAASFEPSAAHCSLRVKQQIDIRLPLAFGCRATVTPATLWPGEQQGR